MDYLNYPPLDKTDHYLVLVGTLIFIITLGALVRHSLDNLFLPYTAILLICGILSALITYYNTWEKFYVLAFFPPKLLLHIFLPILIFESAFAMDSHTFKRTFFQFGLLAIVGLAICTTLTAILSINLFIKYKWNWSTSLLFGSIISATDPVAVVALLRELGISKTLTTLIEGESLLNDGSAMVAFEILQELASDVIEETSVETIILQFFRITLGGPILGCLIGKVAVYCLSCVHNDPLIEITITLSSAYITYMLAEDYFGVSGVLGIVALGIVLSAHKESISPEVEEFVMMFWEVMGYFANTIIFFVVGMVITIKAGTDIEVYDLILLTATYIGINIFRLSMIVILSPILSRTGYGLSWQNAIVITWGGLRGAMSLALALLVFDNANINTADVGSKILVHTGGIVTATLIINATSMQYVLELLGLTQISKQKKSNMITTVRHLKKVQRRGIQLQKNVHFLSDSDWKYVEDHTGIQDSYQPEKEHEDGEAFGLSTGRAIPSRSNLRIMMNNARVRVLHLQKTSFWRQFEQGLLTSNNVHQLLVAVDFAEDKEGKFLTVRDLKQNWKVFSVFYWLKNSLEKRKRTPMSSLSKPKMITQNKIDAFDLLTHPLFIVLSIMFIFLTVLLVLIDIVYHCVTTKCIVARYNFLLWFDALIVVQYCSEIFLKVYTYGVLGFWITNLHKLDIVLFIIFLGDLSLDIAYVSLDFDEDYTLLFNLHFGRFIKCLRALHMTHLYQDLLQQLYRYTNDYIDSQLHAGFDMGCAYMASFEEVIRMLEDIVDYGPIINRLQSICEENLFLIKSELAQFQEHHRSVVVAVKTRHAAQNILNNVKDELSHLKHSGLLDLGVYNILLQQIDHKKQVIVYGPKAILPSPPLEILKNIEWITGNKSLFIFLKSKVKVQMFKKGEYIGMVGEPPKGIFIITIGFIKVEGNILVQENGMIPNTDSYAWFSANGDFFVDSLTTGSVLGELGVLCKRERSTSSYCETEVQALYISQDDMYSAIEHYKQPSLEDKLWRCCSLKIGHHILMKHPIFADWPQSRLILHLERSYLPHILPIDTFDISTGMEDTILIQGRGVDPATKKIYRGVQYIPSDVQSLFFENPVVIPKMLVIVNLLNITDVDEEEELDYGPYNKYLTNKYGKRTVSILGSGHPSGFKLLLKNTIKARRAEAAERAAKGLDPLPIDERSFPSELQTDLSHVINTHPHISRAVTFQDPRTVDSSPTGNMDESHSLMHRNFNFGVNRQNAINIEPFDTQASSSQSEYVIGPKSND